MTAQYFCPNIWRRYCSLLGPVSSVKLRFLMTSSGTAEAYIPLGAVGHWQLREWLTLRRAVNSNYATSTEEISSKASSQDTTSPTEDIQLGEVELRTPTGGPCMYGFRASIHLPHLTSSRPDTYLNHRGRTTDPKRKMLY